MSWIRSSNLKCGSDNVSLDMVGDKGWIGGCPQFIGIQATEMGHGIVNIPVGQAPELLQAGRQPSSTELPF